MTRTRIETAVRKAGRGRLLADMRTAAETVATARLIFAQRFPRYAYVVGAADAAGSLTLRAALLTAFGA
jgi:hypothetical protein